MQASSYESLVRGKFRMRESTSVKKNIFSPLRPLTYYDDCPSDAVSSDEIGLLLEKDGPIFSGSAERAVLNGDEQELRVGGRKSSWTLRLLILSLAFLVLLATGIGVLATISHLAASGRGHLAQKITMDHVFNGSLSPLTKSLHWVPEAGDGVFSVFEDGVIDLVDLKSNTTTTLVRMVDVRDEKNEVIHWSDWKLSPDMKYILVKANKVEQWHHSSFGNYFVHDLETHSTFPIVPPSDPPITKYAAWSPDSQAIAYVVSNDLYVLPSISADVSPIRVTSTGSTSLSHGVPDWVYEEDVFSTDFTLWWSPDSTRLAFLSFDDTAVGEFSFPVYNPSDDANAVVPYPQNVVLKYPKPGYSNPLVTAHVFDLGAYTASSYLLETSQAVESATAELTWEGRFYEDNSIIMEVAWVGPTALMIKEVNRQADAGNVVLFDGETLEGSGGVTNGVVVRKLGKDGEEGDDGWIESRRSIYPLPPSASSDIPAYLDIVPTKAGYNHIALFSPANSSTPVFLTEGEWEVDGSVQAVDAARGLVYFSAARSSIERHLYSVPLPPSLGTSGIADAGTEQEEPTLLTDASAVSSYRTSFSPGVGFYLLSYLGPGIPWQKVVKVDDSDFIYVVSDNAALNATWSTLDTPDVIYSTIEIDSHELNVKEIRPPHMDTSGRTKHPVLFHPYGGPESQYVAATFENDWHSYLASSLGYITVVVDGRGTGFKGRAMRNVVRNQLGNLETVDQIAAARIWAQKNYVDESKIGVWGKSFGGFMSTKIAEANAGVHSLAIAVAPPTSWLFYDSIYTERYMGLPAMNPDGYKNTSITSVEGFRNLDYMLIHGSGDDNVHFANSAHLLDMLTAGQVRNFRFRMFTDSTHSMSRRGASREMYEYMRAFLVEKWGTDKRKGG